MEEQRKIQHNHFETNLILELKYFENAAVKDVEQLQYKKRLFDSSEIKDQIIGSYPIFDDDNLLGNLKQK